MIEDMGSANGVWIDGQRISQAVAISEGDVYTVSDETLTFQFR
jgi:pSer/pThr/pTyr-binding forkhead associated (FHA) protein